MQRQNYQADEPTAISNGPVNSTLGNISAKVNLSTEADSRGEGRGSATIVLPNAIPTGVLTKLKTKIHKGKWDITTPSLSISRPELWKLAKKQQEALSAVATHCQHDVPIGWGCIATHALQIGPLPRTASNTHSGFSLESPVGLGLMAILPLGTVDLQIQGEATRQMVLGDIAFIPWEQKVGVALQRRAVCLLLLVWSSPTEPPHLVGFDFVGDWVIQPPAPAPAPAPAKSPIQKKKHEPKAKNRPPPLPTSMSTFLMP
jgi:hypothetical protein